MRHLRQKKGQLCLPRAGDPKGPPLPSTPRSPLRMWGAAFKKPTRERQMWGAVFKHLSVKDGCGGAVFKHLSVKDGCGGAVFKEPAKERRRQSLRPGHL